MAFVQRVGEDRMPQHPAKSLVVSTSLHDAKRNLLTGGRTFYTRDDFAAIKDAGLRYASNE